MGQAVSRTCTGLTGKMNGEKKSKLEDKPLTALLKISEKACFIMADFVQAVYKKLNDDRKMMKKKADNSFFTIADALVQHMVLTLFPDSKFLEFCGEESAKGIEVSQRPYSVDSMPLPDDIADHFETAYTKIKELARQVDKMAYQDIALFVDPIDGTREFCTGLGQQCSICIGFVRDKVPVAGIVFRPIPVEGHKHTWVAGCKTEGYCNGRLDKVKEDGSLPKTILTSNGSISKFTEKLLDELKWDRYRAGGCGNKMMLLLEGKGTMYIQDRGVSRWDTCAAQAAIEAYGGVLCKLTSVEKDKTYTSYQYKVGDSQLDFNASAMLTKYNVKDKALLKQEKLPAITTDNVNPYSNICGLFAANTPDQKLLNSVMDAVQKVAKDVKPQYS